MAGILDLLLNRGLFGGGGLLGGQSPGGLYGSQGNDQVWNEQPTQAFDPKARQRAAMKQGLLYAGAGLMSAPGWGNGLSRGLLGYGQGSQQGSDAYMQDAAFNMEMQDRQAAQQRQQAVMDAWRGQLNPTAGDTLMGGGGEMPALNLTPAQRQLANTLLAAGDTEGLTKLMMDASKPGNTPGKPGEYLAAQEAGLIPRDMPYQDFLKMDDSQTSLIQEYEYAKGQGYQGTLEDFKRTMAEAGRSSVSLSVDTTEGERDTAGYFNRASMADQVISNLASQGYSGATAGAGVDAALAKLPVLGNFLTSEEQQLFKNAENDFIAAVLRKESGAVISAEEYETYGPMYFPRPGDAQDVLQRKATLRQQALSNLRYSAGPAAPATPPGSTAVPPPPAGFEIVQ